MQESIPAEFRDVTDENEKPDIYRLRWMGALVGAGFAICGILVFSGGCLVAFELLREFEMISIRDYTGIMKFITKQNSVGIGLTYLFFLIVATLAGMMIVKPIHVKGRSMGYGFLYGLFVVFLSLWFGLNTIMLAVNGWKNAMEFLQDSFSVYVAMFFGVFGISLAFAGVFGPLFGMTIKKLSKTPGFGIRKKE